MAAPVAAMCSNKECGEGSGVIDTATMSLVRIRIPPKDAKRLLKCPEVSQVRWERNGVAQFHRACWEAVLEGADRPTAKLPKHADARSLSQLNRECISDASETAETTDPLSKVKEIAKAMHELIQSREHIMFFTGAGISTSAGIGDYRGLFGKWNEEDLGVDRQGSTASASGEAGKGEGERGDDEDVPYEKLRPTLTHEAVKWIVDSKPAGNVTVVTQNCDGLHELTGLGPDIVAPLHGCIYTEVCTNPRCGRRYTRNHYVCDDAGGMYYEERQDILEAGGDPSVLGPPPPLTEECPTCKLNHLTGRFCDDCKAPLKDSIINFGDDLEDKIWKMADNASKRAASMRIVLGTSVLVNPACRLVTNMARRKEIFVCNRQATGADTKATHRVFCDCDLLMGEVMRLFFGGSEDKYQAWLATLQEKRKGYDALRSEGAAVEAESKKTKMAAKSAAAASVKAEKDDGDVVLLDSPIKSMKKRKERAARTSVEGDADFVPESKPKPKPKGKGKGKAASS